MPIEVRNDPAPNVLGPAAYQAGLSQWIARQRELQQQQAMMAAQMEQRERLAMAGLAADERRMAYGRYADLERMAFGGALDERKMRLGGELNKAARDDADKLAMDRERAAIGAEAEAAEREREARLRDIALGIDVEIPRTEVLPPAAFKRRTTDIRNQLDALSKAEASMRPAEFAAQQAQLQRRLEALVEEEPPPKITPEDLDKEIVLKKFNGVDYPMTRDKDGNIGIMRGYQPPKTQAEIRSEFANDFAAWQKANTITKKKQSASGTTEETIIPGIDEYMEHRAKLDAVADQRFEQERGPQELPAAEMAGEPTPVADPAALRPALPGMPEQMTNPAMNPYAQPPVITPTPAEPQFEDLSPPPASVTPPERPALPQFVVPDGMMFDRNKTRTAGKDDAAANQSIASQYLAPGAMDGTSSDELENTRRILKDDGERFGLPKDVNAKVQQAIAYELTRRHDTEIASKYVAAAEDGSIAKVQKPTLESALKSIDKSTLSKDEKTAAKAAIEKGLSLHNRPAGPMGPGNVAAVQQANEDAEEKAQILRQTAEEVTLREKALRDAKRAAIPDKGTKTHGNAEYKKRREQTIAEAPVIKTAAEIAELPHGSWYINGNGILVAHSDPLKALIQQGYMKPGEGNFKEVLSRVPVATTAMQLANIEPGGAYVTDSGQLKIKAFTLPRIK